MKKKNRDIFEGEESEDSWDNSKPSKESLDILAFLSTRGIRSCESRNENGASYMNNSKKLAERSQAGILIHDFLVVIYK